MYIFALFFVQSLAGYLADTPNVVDDEETFEGIKSYWDSVPQAAVTLYMAVSGGSDWEPLAAPLKNAGTGYYCVFLFYIAFSMVSLLNVVTGMFVDTAMKVSENDGQEVLEEIMENNE